MTPNTPSVTTNVPESRAPQWQEGLIGSATYLATEKVMARLSASFQEDMNDAMRDLKAARQDAADADALTRLGREFLEMAPMRVAFYEKVLLGTWRAYEASFEALMGCATGGRIARELAGAEAYGEIQKIKYSH